MACCNSDTHGPDYNQLPFRVNFVCKQPERWPELFSGERVTILDPDTIPERIVSLMDSWVVCTYLRLAAAGANVRIVDRAVPGEICVVDGHNIGIRDWSYNSFIICCRGDSYDPTLSDWVVVQNGIQTSIRKSTFIPVWPQPGLLPRNDSRGSTIVNLAYTGHIVNLDDAFKTASFQSALANIGVHLRMEVHDDQFAQTIGWNDFRTTDAYLAARNLTIHDALIKPPTKLVNAWAAGVPALLGPEPAFRELRKSNLDYIEIRRPVDVLMALRQLKEQPALYSAMIANGRSRFAEFTTANNVKRWLRMLNGPIAAAYSRWRTESIATRAIRYARRSIQFKLATRDQMRKIYEGPRILD
jgi:hypothetical protein